MSGFGLVLVYLVRLAVGVDLRARVDVGFWVGVGLFV